VKKRLLSFAALIIVATPIAVFSMPSAAICAMSVMVGVQSAQYEGIITGTDIIPTKVEEFHATTRQARERIKNDIWGQTSNPEILLLNVEKVFGVLPYNQYGSTIVLPHKTCILIGPKGNNVDVVAHEMLHADIAEQIGYFKFLTLPSWLNEGIAMQVDRRERYKASAILGNAQQVTSISGASFYKGSTPQVVSNYAASKLMVKQWIDEHGVLGLPQLLENNH